MYAYKANGATSHQLVSSLLTHAVVGHWECIAMHRGSQAARSPISSCYG